MARFRFKGTLSGRPMTIETFVPASTEDHYVGDIVNLETGELDPAVTSDTALIGAIVGTEDPDTVSAAGLVTAVDSTTKIRVITNWDAIYEVTDANARVVGATLDITGAAGSQTLAASSNTEFVVMETSTATEDTQVIITPSAHYLAGT